MMKIQPPSSLSCSLHVAAPDRMIKAVSTWRFLIVLLVLQRSERPWCSPVQAVAAQEVRSKCPGRCAEFGTCNEELGRCDCPKDREGEDCSKAATPATLAKRCRFALYPSVKECTTYPQSCVNACNKRGRCVAGFCHCESGHYGADCSLSLAADGRPVLLAGTPYQTRSKRPHVYVYELPPHLTTWVNTRRLDRPTHNLFTQRLLSSWARTADGDAADWYFIPVRCRRHSDGYFLREALDYIAKTWPWWNKLQGARHFLIHTGDLGVQENPLDLRERMANSTWLTHWGLHKDRRACCNWWAAHRPGRDIVIPVYISTGSFSKFGFTRSPLHPAATQHPRQQTFFFAGRICGDRKEPALGEWPNCKEGQEYSANARQMVHYYHQNRSNYMVVTHTSHYDRHLRSSRFCLAPLGGGHGQRQIVVASMGCIPVTIGDHVLQPFEPELDWSAFSVPVAEKDIPVLHEKLAEVEARPGAVASLQQALHCAAQHMIYSSITGGFLGEQGKYDAFETTLEILRVMAKYPGTDSAQLASVDADFRRFLNCGADGHLGQFTAGDLLVSRSNNSSDKDSGNGISAVLADAGLEGKGDLTPEHNAEAPAAANAERPTFATSLCSTSRYDAAERGEVPVRPACFDCLTGASTSHGLPGGAICCGSGGNLAKCFRNWD